MYHRLSEHVDNKYTVSYSSFIDQMKLLKSTNFIIEGFDGLEKRLVSNNWPKKYAVLTFDDGYKSNLQAAEILSFFNADATFFITKNYVNISHYMRYLCSGGVVFASKLSQKK